METDTTARAAIAPPWGWSEKYRVAGFNEEAEIIALCRKRTEAMTPAGNIDRWERGWAENLAAYRASRDVRDLRPKYIRPGGPLRLNGKFIVAEDPDYEWHWYQRFREQVAARWIEPGWPVFEFGCGSGHNVAWLAEHYDEVYGLDWAMPSVDICRELRKRWKGIGTHRFDLFAPDTTFAVEGTVLTVGTMEQTGRLWTPFLRYLLRQKPHRVVHIEPFVELYDADNPVDQTAIAAHKKRGFWTGYLDMLKELHDEGRIEVECVQRTGFGSLMIEGYSLCVWRPL